MSLLQIVNQALPESLLAIGGILLLIFGLFFKSDSRERFNLTLYLTSLLLIAVAFFINPSEESFSFNASLKENGFISYGKILILVSSIVTLVISKNFFARKSVQSFELFPLIVFSVLGMFIMISANSFLYLYLGLELQSLSIYIITAIEKNSRYSVEAAFKYFVLGAIASGFILYGVSLIYGLYGTFNFTEILKNGAVNPHDKVLLLSLVFIVCGLAFKISAVPFHIWVADVYGNILTPFTLFFSTAPKIAGVIIFIRILLEPFQTALLQGGQLVSILSILSIFVGSLLALRQKNLKRVMAYSSVVNVGFLLTNVVVLATVVSAKYEAKSLESIIEVILFYLSIYIVGNIGVFTVLTSLKNSGGRGDDFFALAGLAKRFPLVGLSLAMFLFSLAGIPPFAGFFAKLKVFEVIISHQMYYFAGLVFVGAVLAAYYYLKVVKVIYFDSINEEISLSLDTNIIIKLLISLCVFVVCGYVIFSRLIEYPINYIT